MVARKCVERIKRRCPKTGFVGVLIGPRPETLKRCHLAQAKVS
jgi:hypothetical protein